MASMTHQFFAFTSFGYYFSQGYSDFAKNRTAPLLS